MMKTLRVILVVAVMLPMSAHAERRRVAAPGDSHPPQLLSLWLDRASMRVGETNKLFVRAQDDRTGIALISGVFLSPAKHARIGFACRLGIDGVWECSITPPACLDCGTWQLEQLQLQDKANNFVAERVDNPLVAAIALNISGDSCDAMQPDVTAIALDRNVVSNVEASTVTVTSTVFDDTCGIASVTGMALGPVTESGIQPRIYAAFLPNGETNAWVAHIPIPKFAAKGVWSIAWIQVIDKANNLRTYSAADPVLSGATFRVE